MNGIDLFAGARGWDIAARRLGWDMDGVECWAPANATAQAAGFRTVHEDVRTFHAERGQYRLGIASPSCKRYSAAGNGAGRRALEHVLTGVRAYASGKVHEFAEARALIGDEDAALTLEPLRIFLACEPEFIALEQTPAVLPIWQAYAEVLRERGYSATCATLSAEQYGVPQTRRRAVLVARRDGIQARMPEPTHSRYWNRDPQRLDEGVKPWVSMAEALGWNHAEFHASKRMGAGMVERHGERPDRAADLPAFTVRAEAGGMEPGGWRWKIRQSAMRNATVRDGGVPAPTITGAKDWRERVWVLRNGNQEKACVRDEETPSGTLFFGQRANWAGWTEQDGTLIRKVEPEEAACLQTFPSGYPFQGGKSQVMTQIGNAIPPLLAEAILSTFL